MSPPGTPEKDLRLRSASTSQVPNTRTALPSRVPPLGVNRVLTPELRSVPSLDVTQERISVTPQIVDLGKCAISPIICRGILSNLCYSRDSSFAFKAIEKKKMIVIQLKQFELPSS